MTKMHENTVAITEEVKNVLYRGQSTLSSYNNCRIVIMVG